MKKTSKHGQFSAPATAALPKRERGAQRNNRNAERHGLYGLRRRIEQNASGAALERARADWMAEVRAARGGDLSPSEETILETASVTWLLLSSVDAWLLEQPSLVNRRRRELLPVVQQRGSLVRDLRALLGDIGLKRVPRQAPSLAGLVAQYSAGREEPEDPDAA